MNLFEQTKEAHGPCKDNKHCACYYQGYNCCFCEESSVNSYGEGEAEEYSADDALENWDGWYDGLSF